MPSITDVSEKILIHLINDEIQKQFILKRYIISLLYIRINLSKNAIHPLEPNITARLTFNAKRKRAIALSLQTA